MGEIMGEILSFSLSSSNAKHEIVLCRLADSSAESWENSRCSKPDRKQSPPSGSGPTHGTCWVGNARNTSQMKYPGGILIRSLHHPIGLFWRPRSSGWRSNPQWMPNPGPFVDLCWWSQIDNELNRQIIILSFWVLLTNLLENYCIAVLAKRVRLCWLETGTSYSTLSWQTARCPAVYLLPLTTSITAACHICYVDLRIVTTAALQWCQSWLNCYLTVQEVTLQSIRPLSVFGLHKKVAHGWFEKWQ